MSERAVDPYQGKFMEQTGVKHWRLYVAVVLYLYTPRQTDIFFLAES